MEQKATKNYFKLNLGLNSEHSEISFPDGYSVDEANYELLSDGSRRRRKGLALETGGSGQAILDAFTDTTSSQSYLWKNVGGNPNLRYHVHKIGKTLYFSEDTETPSLTWHASTIDLDDYVLNDSGESMVDQPCDFTQGKGELFVAGTFTGALRIQYIVAEDTFVAEFIDIQIRDYQGIDDGIPVNVQPAASVLADLTDDHLYNLVCRGWPTLQIAEYCNDQNLAPAKNMVWYKGYRRLVPTNYAEVDGTQEWDSDKLAAEAFGKSTAPMGGIYLKPSNDSLGYVEYLETAGTGDLDEITSWALHTTNADTLEWEFDYMNSFSGGEIFWMTFTYDFAIAGIDGFVKTESGPMTVMAEDLTATSFKVTVSKPHPLYNGQATTIGSAYISTSTEDVGLTRSIGTGPINVGPKAIEFHNGRLFYAGVDDKNWADYIFFSQVCDTTRNYNRCHQEADPTDPYNNSRVLTDGGFFVIPNVGNVLKLLSYKSSVFVFSDEGVWEVAAGRSGIFTPEDYVIRKVTSAESNSPYSPIEVEGQVVYTSPKGVYAIGPNQYTGLHEATNISDDRIRTFWNSIGTTYAPLVKTVYDDAQKRLLIMHGGSGNITSDASVTDLAKHYNTIFILDLRIGAWYKYEFSNSANVGLVGAFALSGADNSNSTQKLKFICQVDTDDIEICDFNHTDYIDFTDAESPIPFILTGWDNLGDHQRRRQAPIVTVFNKRTETGYTDTGSGWAPVNPSSTKLTPRWDWTNDSVTGKIGTTVQVYRHARPFTPASADDVDGYPVVVTRNKIRGRGRALQLYFNGEATYDSHLLGYTLNYKVNTEV